MPNSFCHRMWLSVALSIAVLTFPGVAQQSQAPQPGIAEVELGSGPYTFDTAEQHKVRVTVVARNLVHPFSIAFLQNGDALLVERGSGLQILDDGAVGEHQPADVQYRQHERRPLQRHSRHAAADGAAETGGTGLQRAKPRSAIQRRAAPEFDSEEPG